MKKIYSTINEAAVTELQKLIVSKFGTRFLNQYDDYIATITDLQIVFDCINQVIFNNKLPNIKFEIVNIMPNDIGKAVFLFDLRNHSVPPIIKYLADAKNDTPLSMTDAICHEMIHYYDYMFGPLSMLAGKTVSYVNGKQMIGDYDAHGDFFQKIMNNIISNGIPVSIEHPGRIKVRYFMNNEELKENEEVPTLAERAKMFYDAIKTDDIFLVEVKGDHVYCVMQ